MAIEISRREFVVGATAGLTFAFARAPPLSPPVSRPTCG